MWTMGAAAGRRSFGFGRARRSVVPLAALTLSVVLGSCGRDGADGFSSPRDVAIDRLGAHVGDLIVVEGFLVVDPDGEATLCSGLAESYPPQCGGTRLPVTKFDVNRLADTSTNADAPDDQRVVWTDDPVAFTGELVSADGNLRLQLVTDAVSEGSAVFAIASSGPHCPVESDPPDPSCAARAVANARVELQQAGDSKLSVSTDALGVALIFGPSGEYVLVARPVEGLLGTPEPVEVVIDDGISAVELSYDTGIR